MKAEVLTIGDELLRGEIVDSNKALIAQCLLQSDIECHFQTSVRDDPADMGDALKRAISRSDLVLISGGLGPTRDDLTTEVLADSFGRELKFDEGSFQIIREFFARVGRQMSDSNRKQAFFPEGSEILPNPIGTAPGFMLEEQGALLFAMPGVPRELSRMMDEEVMPRIAAHLAAHLTAHLAGDRETTRVRARLLRTFGMGESSLETELADIARDGQVELAFRTSFPDNFLRVIARGHSISEVDDRIAAVVDTIHERLGDLIYGEGEEGLESVVGRMLLEGEKTLAVAESCTGGLIAGRLTDIPGSSAYFLGGVVAYANRAKRDLLGVPEALLAEHGAVSAAVAGAMAEGVRTRFGADIGIATTGISGPGGGTAEKPVGLVYLGISADLRDVSSGEEKRGEDADAPASELLHSDGFVFELDRPRHRILTAQVALDWVRRSLLGAELLGPGLFRHQGGGSVPGAHSRPASSASSTSSGASGRGE
jgi:nicotinamide-nucleotide amidase